MTYAVVVSGACGRMGRRVAEALREAGYTDLAGCDPAERAEVLVLDSGPLPLVPDVVAGITPGGTIVDFSHPAATPGLARAARERGARLVVGTTGQDARERAALEEAAKEVPVVWARNFSLGLNRLLEVLPQLGVLAEEGFDVECLEAHHRAKRDAPSGTAALLLEALLGPDAADRRVYGRRGAEARRQPGEVGVHSLRLGGLAGDHALLLASDHELIEIRHRALDRGAFVSGVVPAVRFVAGSGPGLYSMLDVMRDAESPAS